MSNDLLKRYVAIWNEPDATLRRDGVASLWAPDGLHYTQTRKFRGIPELDARVTEAYEQFVAGAGLLFVSGNDLVTHHNVAKFSWQMVRPDGDPVAVGFDFLILDDNGRILVDYQFNEPPVPSADLDRLAVRYLSLTQEAGVTELYAAGSRLVDEFTEHSGPSAIAAYLAKTQAALSSAALVRRLAGHASAQHNAIRFNWQDSPVDGGDPVQTGFEFLVRDDGGQVVADYRFTD